MLKPVNTVGMSCVSLCLGSSDAPISGLRSEALGARAVLLCCHTAQRDWGGGRGLLSLHHPTPGKNDILGAQIQCFIGPQSSLYEGKEV